MVWWVHRNRSWRWMARSFRLKLSRADPEDWVKKILKTNNFQKCSEYRSSLWGRMKDLPCKTHSVRLLCLPCPLHINDFFFCDYVYSGYYILCYMYVCMSLSSILLWITYSDLSSQDSQHLAQYLRSGTFLDELRNNFEGMEKEGMI